MAFVVHGEISASSEKEQSSWWSVLVDAWKCVVLKPVEDRKIPSLRSAEESWVVGDEVVGVDLVDGGSCGPARDENIRRCFA